MTERNASKPKPEASSPFGLATAWQEYAIDFAQRSLLFWDVLRERGNQFVEHERSGKPPVLAFDYHVVLDGRTLEMPANYQLMRIEPDPAAPVDPRSRPIVVIDPRAGHGPGIGGFKLDSQIGNALRTGHPCYFVAFLPEPVPGQTIAAVARAEAVFLKRVAELHPEAEGKPFVIGNCQGGWALLMLAAAAPELVGPILLAGSPVSYWAGVKGLNPMRYSGGLLGGSWLASLTADLGNGRFDGAHLVTNFEALNPANTLWSKLYNVWSRVDTEPPRFLEFERWWGGHYLMNKEEIEWIVQNLFIGNKLASGEIHSADGRSVIDIRNVRSPIIVFASWGDNITPPQQALNWILDLYRDVDEIRANQQTIVYCLHEKIGHLGIFVSGKVAGRETAELIDGINMIDTLPPGLYEAKIDDLHPEMSNLELVDGRYLMRFEPRTLEDILALDDGREDERAFEVVRRVSEINQGLYDTFVSPVVRAGVNESSAQALRALHPSRTERYLFSDLNPLMAAMRSGAEIMRGYRRPVAADNPFLAVERQVSSRIETSLESWGKARDDLSEKLFKAIYESPFAAATVGLTGRIDARRSSPITESLRAEVARLKMHELRRQTSEGGALAAVLRILVYQREPDSAVDERSFQMARRLLDELPPEIKPGLALLKETLRQQALQMRLDPDAAIAALPGMVPDLGQRRRMVDSARRVATARGKLTPGQEQRFARIENVLGLGPMIRAAEVA